jgi:hypothetical protein
MLSVELNIKYDSRKSVIKINIRLVTTEEVVDCPTPLEPPLAFKPQLQLTMEISKPNTSALIEEYKRSR